MHEIIKTETASLLYISTAQCGVCKVIKPQIAELFSQEFPKIGLYSIDSEETPEIAAQMSIFAVPTVLIFIDGQEFVRVSRNIAMSQLIEKVKRPYEMFFE